MRILATAVGSAVVLASGSGALATPKRSDPRAGMKVIRDVSYGPLPAERLDVYAPARARNAPVVLLVHGGGWITGDKAAASVVDNKVGRWVPRGFVVISANYPMLPATPPVQQARYVAKALAFAQRHASRWGGSRNRFIVMGHSAGAHLVSLIGAAPALTAEQGATPWLGTVALDSAAYSVPAIMRSRHLPLYDIAFGDDPARWAAASPTVRLHSRIAPFLGVCSSLRADSCRQARTFVSKATSFGTHAEVLPVPLGHGEVNSELGLQSAYTGHVESFMRTLGPAVARMLPKR